MARYIKTDSSEAGRGIDHADTEGHKMRRLDDTDATDDTERRRIDHADTEGHKVRWIDDATSEPSRRMR